MAINQLVHVTKKLASGGHVVVLNTGAEISPEAEAMLQALHSRSTGGVKEHLVRLAEKGSDKFMASFYVGYGHKSIGDCGTCTLFIEGVSMLAAKAIQDWPLYSGQESSTRYIDFANQPFIDPLGSPESKKILETWRAFYLECQEPVRAHLKKLFPRNSDEEEKIYDKAISARGFDILRGFLPAGAGTNLAWHTNLRQAADRLMVLRHHPLAEVQDIANVLEQALQDAFPSSFSHKRYEETEAYNRSWMKRSYYYSEENPQEFALTYDGINRELLASYRSVLESRPEKTELPKHLAECGTVQFSFLLDFGSFRDIQRHRSAVQRMPLLTTTHGFSPWYIESLSDELRKKAKELLSLQERTISGLRIAPEMMQYYVPMGYLLPNRITGSLPALVYLAELRATRFVHPTLAKRAGEMAEALSKTFGSFGLTLHLDQDPGRFDIKRGKHDIVIK